MKPDECQLEAIKCDKNLLLGNGFSIACSNIFSYDSILNKSSLAPFSKSSFPSSDLTK